jgi:hypothetical protein
MGSDPAAGGGNSLRSDAREIVGISKCADLAVEEITPCIGGGLRAERLEVPKVHDHSRGSDWYRRES